MKWKQTTPPKEAVTNNNTGAGTGNGYSKIPRYKWVDGANIFRVLPQQEDAVSENFTPFQEYSIYDRGSKKYLCSFALKYEDDTLNRIFSCLWNNKLAEMIKTPNNQAGVIQLSTSYRMGWQGLDLAKNDGVVYFFALSGTRPLKKKEIEAGKQPKHGAGAKIANLSFAKKPDGSLKYGDICHPITGRIIQVDVTNAGTMDATYDVSVDVPHEITADDWLGVKEMEDVIKYATNAELADWFAAYVQPEIFEMFVKAKIFHPRQIT
jgi:hypothetical protein